MDITVIVPSRGRPRQLSGTLTSLHTLESGKHNVRYGVACDEDDAETIALCKAIQDESSLTRHIPLSYRVGTRPASLGGLFNAMAEAMPADVYLVLCDDLICASAHWDDVIAEAVRQLPMGVFWWKAGFPEITPLYPIISETWRKAVGSIFTEDYPYWFDDLCLAELWTMATDRPCVPLPIVMMDKPFKTTRMRDLWFWREFYKATRPMRVRQAYDVAKKLGLPIPEKLMEVCAQFTEEQSHTTKPEMDSIEEGQGEKTPPDPVYLAQKQRAENIMQAIKMCQPKGEPACPVTISKALSKTLIPAKTSKSKSW